MNRAAWICALALSAALAAPAWSLERVSAKAQRDKQTSSLEQVSTKPLFIFNMRGRQDPFMAYALMTVTASTEHFSIANLSFTGLLQVQGSMVALFKDHQGQTYTLKGGHLHGLDNQRLTQVRGRISADRQVALEQGEKRIVYSNQSTSKRLLDARSR